MVAQWGRRRADCGSGTSSNPAEGMPSYFSFYYFFFNLALSPSYVRSPLLSYCFRV